MLDWFQFNGVSSFIYIIVLLLVFKLLGTMLGNRIENNQNCNNNGYGNQDCDDNGYGNQNCSSDDICDFSDSDCEDSSGDIILEIRKNDMYNMIMAIRKLQYRMRDIQ